jgi:hypothetical protein
MRAALSVALIVSMLAPAPAAALTGEEWQRLAAPARAAYVTGVIDAWVGFVLLQESFGGADRGITVFGSIVSCLRDRLIGPEQVTTAVEQHVQGQPGQQASDMPDLVFVAIARLCH